MRGLRVYLSCTNAPKVAADDYIDSVITSPKVFSGVQAAAAQPGQAEPPPHYAFTRLESDPAALRVEAQPQVEPTGSVIDATPPFDAA